MKAWLAKHTLARRTGYALGVVYVLIGIVGFVVTAGVGFFDTAGKDLILFELNPLHNVVHLLIGGALLYAARAGAGPSKLMNTLIGGTYLLVGIIGAFVVQMDPAPGLIAVRSDLNILALNHPDNFLHIASAIVLVGSALLAHRRTAGRVIQVEEIQESPQPIVKRPAAKAKSKSKAKRSAARSATRKPVARGSRR